MHPGLRGASLKLWLRGSWKFVLFSSGPPGLQHESCLWRVGPFFGRFGDCGAVRVLMPVGGSALHGWGTKFSCLELRGACPSTAHGHGSAVFRLFRSSDACGDI